MSKWKKFGDSVVNLLGEYLVEIPYNGEILSHENIKTELTKNLNEISTFKPIDTYITNSFQPFEEDGVSHLFVGEKYQLFGLYDGHIGNATSDILENILLREIEEEIVLQEEEDLQNAIIEGFRICDKKIIQKEKMSGATGIVVCVDSEKDLAYIANTGNCKAILGSKNEDSVWVSEVLTNEHLASIEEDLLRNKFPADDEIVVDGKIKGMLAYSRSFGDALFKRGGRVLAGGREDWYPPYISVDPEITILDLASSREHEESIEFIVLGSEGLFTHMTPNQVVHLIGESVSNEESTLEEGVISVIGGCLESAAQRGLNFEERVSSVILTPGGFQKLILQDISISILLLS